MPESPRPMEPRELVDRLEREVVDVDAAAGDVPDGRAPDDGNPDVHGSPEPPD